jgi:hypothetical protein
MLAEEIALLQKLPLSSLSYKHNDLKTDLEPELPAFTSDKEPGKLLSLKHILLRSIFSRNSCGPGRVQS